MLALDAVDDVAAACASARTLCWPAGSKSTADSSARPSAPARCSAPGSGGQRILGKTFAGFGPKSVLAGRLEEHSRLLGKTFGPGSVFSARLEEHRRLLGMIGDLAQAVAFEDVAVAESLDASADLAGVDPTKIRPELLSAALAALWLTWLIAAWLDYANNMASTLNGRTGSR